MSVNSLPQQSPLCLSIDIYYIAQAAGYGHRNPAWIVAWVHDLIDRHALPAPITPENARFYEITLSSRWQRIEIDPWLARGFPPLVSFVPPILSMTKDANTPLLRENPAEGCPVPGPDHGGAAA